MEAPCASLDLNSYVTVFDRIAHHQSLYLQQADKQPLLCTCLKHRRWCHSQADRNAMQAHLAQLALGDIFAALEVHQDQSDLQAKGLVALGVLGQVRPRLSSFPIASKESA